MVYTKTKKGPNLVIQGLYIIINKKVFKMYFALVDSIFLDLLNNSGVHLL